MEHRGWRTVVAGSGEHLSLRDGCLLIQGEEERTIPLLQIRELILERPRGTVTLALLDALGSFHINVLLCDEKTNPASELVPFSDHHQTAGCILDQSRWQSEDKARVWGGIVRDKLRMQGALLERLGLLVPDGFRACLSTVLPGDSSNREGMAARLYFTQLFGPGFLRHAPDDLNAALNYGYAILRACFNRILTLHGYHTALGIWHCSRSNRFNLSCDLMEPFRPFVDEIVFHLQGEDWGQDSRKQLIRLLHTRVRLGGQSMELPNAAEQYALDVLRAMEDKKVSIREVDYY